MNRKTTTIIAILAVAMLFSTVGMASAVIIDGHNITFINHTYDDMADTSTWCYNVTSGSSAALSNWIICWCNESAIAGASENWEYVSNTNKPMPGIKFDNEYADGESRDVCFTLYGDYPENGWINVSIKEGNDGTGDSKVGYGWVTGPRELDSCPCCPTPELSTSILVSVGLLTLIGYFTLRRKD